MGIFATETANAGQTFYFPHRDEDYLRASQRNGAAAYLPSAIDASEPTPVIVLLHGTNSSGELHLWFGGARRDLRPVVETLTSSGKTKPFILAGPSQTRSAHMPQALWSKFELSAFIADLKSALGERALIDKEKIVLAGHSGAGCNPNGGIANFGQFSTNLLALVAIDPCLNSEMGEAFARRQTHEPLWLLWQNMVWPRAFEKWRTALTEPPTTSRRLRIDRLSPHADNPHDAIVPLALRNVARELFPNAEEQPPALAQTSDSEAHSREPHEAKQPNES